MADKNKQQSSSNHQQVSIADKNKQPSSSNHQQISHLWSQNPAMKRRMDKCVTEWEKQKNPTNTKEAEIIKKGINLKPQKKNKNDEK